MTRWPKALTVTVSPGSTTVVEATSSMMAGPSITFPAGASCDRIPPRLGSPDPSKITERAPRRAAGEKPHHPRDLRELGLSQTPDGRYTQAYDVGRFFRRAVAIAQLVGLVEQPLDLCARRFSATWPACARPPHAPDRHSACRRPARTRFGRRRCPTSPGLRRPSVLECSSPSVLQRHLQIVHRSNRVCT